MKRTLECMGFRDKILKTVGVEITAGETPEQLAQRRRWEETLPNAWHHVRVRIDKGVREYYQNRSTATLEEVCTPQVVQDIIQWLDALRTQYNCVWVQPKRMQETKPQYKVIHENIKPGAELPDDFTIQESFLDASKFPLLSPEGLPTNQMAHALDGSQRVALRATVVVEDHVTYRVTSIRPLNG